MLKPWRDLIHGLFPNTDVEAKVLKALQEAPGKQFAAFRAGGPDPVFQGHAHCEAVLGCLYSLTKRGEDISWVSTIARFCRGVC